MASKQKEVQIGQKVSFERQLKARLALLSKEGIEAREVDKDTIVKKLRGNIEAINARLKAIDAIEKKTEELARIKAEKAATPPKDPEGVKEKVKKENPAESKEKKKKK